MYIIQQENFEGPLELLYELIEKEKMPISRVSLARVAEDYTFYVRSRKEIDPETLTEFLVVAAQLMLIKSKSLLPKLEIADMDEQSLDELEKRLVLYKRMRELSEGLKEMEKKRSFLYSRQAYEGFSTIFFPPSRLGHAHLYESMISFLSAQQKPQALQEKKMKKILTLEERAAHIRSLLSQSLEKSFADLAGAGSDKMTIIVSFLALLELVRNKFLCVRQDNLFEEIRVVKR